MTAPELERATDAMQSALEFETPEKEREHAPPFISADDDLDLIEQCAHAGVVSPGRVKLVAARLAIKMRIDFAPSLMGWVGDDLEDAPPKLLAAIVEHFNLREATPL